MDAYSKALQKLGSPSPGKAPVKADAMGELASLLFHSRTQAHVFHLRTTSYAMHKALNDYYDAIIGIADGIIEAYQGMNGLVTFKSEVSIDNNASTDNVLKYFDMLCTEVDRLRKESSLSASFLQNEIDNVCKLLYETKYKIKILK
jgi:hypothetical protein